MKRSSLKELFSHLKEMVNINELTFDITLSAAAILVYRLIVPAAGFLLINMNYPLMLTVVVCVEFFVALFFADIVRSYWDASKKSKIVKYILCVTVFFAVNGLYILMPWELLDIAWKITKQTGSPGADMFLIFTVLTLTGFIVCLAGIIMFRGHQALVRWLFIAIFPALTMALSFPECAIYFGFAYGIWASLIFLFISAVIVFGIYHIKRRLFYHEPKKSPRMVNLKTFSRNYIIPFITALTLIAWHEMILSGSVKQLLNENSPINLGSILCFLLISGFIPVRVLIMFTPPVKPVNIAISVGSLCIYFASLNSVLGRLIEAHLH